MRYLYAVLILTLSLTVLRAADLSKADADRILKDEKANAQALFSLSFYFEQAGRPFSALSAIERAIELKANVPGFHARYGQLLAQRRRLKEAAAAYGKAAEMDQKTKAFRAAQARAHAQAGQLKEAIAAWRILLDGTTDKQEVLDAAGQIAQLAYQQQAPADAEAAWKTALEKLKDWGDRLQASDSLAQAMLAQRTPDRVFAFWKTTLEGQTDWDVRASLLERLQQSAQSAAPEQQQKLFAETAALWEALANDTANGSQKQQATRTAAGILLRTGQAQRAATLLKPVVFSADWDANFQTAQLLARTYGQLDDDAARKAMWEEFIQKTATPLKLEAGKRYPVKIEFFQGAGPSTMKLYWTSPSQKKENIPTASLFTTADAKTGDGLKALYFDGLNFDQQKLERIDPRLDFQWTEASGPDPKKPGTNFSARWTGFIEPEYSEAYTFYTVSDDGIRVWLNNKPIIDNWTNHGPTEDSSSNFQRLYAIYQQLAGCTETPVERIALWQSVVKEHSDQVDAHRELAEAFASARKPSEAVDAYDVLLQTQRQQPNYQWPMSQDHWQRMIQLCAEAGQPERAVKLMIEQFGAIDNHYNVRQWFFSLMTSCGENVAFKAAEEVAKAGGARQAGAAEFLYTSGRPEVARPLFEALAAQENLDRNLRKFALDRQMNMARSAPERTAIARRVLALGGEHWEKTQAFNQLAQCLGMEGKIDEGLQIVRQADQHRQSNHSSGPQTLQSLSQSIRQGNRVGAGLRTPDGQEKAETAFALFYKDFSSRNEYMRGLEQLANALSELHARRGDYDGAVLLLKTLASVRELPRLHLHMASLLERKGDTEGALIAHFDYFTAAGKAHTAELQRNPGFARSRGIQHLDGNCARFLQQTKKTDEFMQRVMQRIEKLSGLEREGAADLALGLCRQLSMPEKTLELVDRLDKWDHKPRLYTFEKQWAEGAIKMKNASSQADTQMRDQLNQQAEHWMKTLNDNPEDYQAALNVYKTYRLLGRGKDAALFLERAAAIAPRDPVVLDLLGREYMLEKNYVGTVQSLKTAAEITGRTEDVEGTMLSAFELSGRSQEAISLALASMAEGRNNGQGLRSVEDLLDVAERTDSLKHLYAEAKRIVTAERDAKRPVRERLAQLTLRLAWDNNDDALASAALDELMRPAPGGAPVWEDGWRMQQLAQRAVERRRLKDAITIRRGMLQGPDLGGYREVAMLLLQVGEAQPAADLMFDGLARADLGDAQGPVPAPMPRPMPLRRRGPRPRPQPASEQQWAGAIIDMAAQESAAGGKAFRTACGERLPELLKIEQERLAKAPAEYSGPLTNPVVEKAFDLRDAVTAAFRDAAQKDDAAPEALVAFARRMAAIASPADDEVRDGSEMLKVIRKALRDAAARCKGRERQRVHEQAAQIFASLLQRPEKERLAGVDADLVLAAYDAALEADAAGLALEVLRRAAEFATHQKRFDRAVQYAKALQTQLPHDNSARRLLADAQLNAHQPAEAFALLKSGFDHFTNSAEYRAAADLLLSTGPVKQDGTPERPIAPEAAAGAAELYARAVTLYLEEVGPQVDAKDHPLPDADLGQLQAQWSRASAAAGKLDEALAQMLAASFNFGGEMKDAAVLSQVAEAYAKAGKIDELMARMDEKVTAEPKNVSFRLAQATALEKANDWARAARALLAARTLDPDLETVKRLIAAFRKAGDYESALGECQGWTDSFPRDAAAYRTMADIYKELKDEHGEVRSLTMLVEVSPRDADNCRQVAVLFAGRKEFSRAIALLERAVEIRGEEPYRHVDLAEVCLLSGDAARAEKILREALTRDWEKGLSPELLARMPQWRGTYETRAHSLLAEALDTQKKTDEAAKERLNVPTGYQRPKLEEAVPVARPQPWGGFRMAER